MQGHPKKYNKKNDIDSRTNCKQKLLKAMQNKFKKTYEHSIS